MPVPTNTMRDITKLNLVFLFSALLLTGATLWMVFADWNRPWRQYPQTADAWKAAMLEDEQWRLEHDQLFQKQIEVAQTQLDEAGAGLDRGTIAKVESKIAQLRAKLGLITLPRDVEKGEDTPANQKLEHAILESSNVEANREKVRQVEKGLSKKQRAVVEAKSDLNQLKRKLAELTNVESEKQKVVDDLLRKINTLKQKRQQAAPSGLAALDAKFRDAPLLDWLNPPIRPHQQVVPANRTDYNFTKVETIDRCKTCHVNIDEPAFTAEAQTRFLNRQIARQQHDPSLDVPDDPVVMLDFWATAAARIPELKGWLDALNEKTIEYLQSLHGEADDGVGLEEEQDVVAHLTQIVAEYAGNDAVSRDKWYAAARLYREDLARLLAEHLGDEQFDRLVELYRRTVVEAYNNIREREGLTTLSDSPVLLAHPNLARYVAPESTHPLKTMGCTVCHEGSGQETQFEHTAHMPREGWVDRKTGAMVPHFLIEHTASPQQTAGALKSSVAADRIAMISESGAGHGDHLTTHHDVNLNGDPGMFSPEPYVGGKHATYRIPGDDRPQRSAVLQNEFWTKKYKWHAIHYTHWEKPMHQLGYVESSCARCHSEVFDIKDEAPKLFEGRKLFSQLGCVNCHAVDSLGDDLDIKRVGPSLVNVKHKLSKQMMANWVWSPKGFRPTTRMPHYFMLANNSAPVDIARTRVETAAIAHYLAGAEPNANHYSKTDQPTPTYRPEALPDQPTNIERGRQIFLNVGCMACHTNLEEIGRQWITTDLQARGHDEEEAAERYDAMSYNQQHWYVLENLPDKLERTGPELSGVGTKLLLGRSEREARGWLYDWLRNPRHYSSYTIMPRFRLKTDEANDLAGYLLTLRRPGSGGGDSAYEPGDFGLDDDGWAMLREIRATQMASKSTLRIARRDVADEYADTGEGRHDLLMDAGESVIRHYGCHGCHLINGLEAETSACTNLDEWGLKNPHKLAFEYFDHPFDKIRKKPIAVWKTKQWGLTADAVQIKPDDDRIHQETIHWEHMDTERRPWLYNKLFNTRLFDRGRTTLDGRLRDPHRFAIDRQDPKVGDHLGKPYDKLKMPMFFLPDDQVQALITYVTSVRKPLVDPSVQKVVDDAGMRVIRGRQLATLYNCYGCHNIESNKVNLQQYFVDEEGLVTDQTLHWAPPRLVGQGAKTKPQWLYHFLQNVEPIRPWLKVRMPSFPIKADEARGLVDYFAGHSQIMARELELVMEQIDKHVATADLRYQTLDGKIKRLQDRLEKAETDAAHNALGKQIELRQTERDTAARNRSFWFESQDKKTRRAVEAMRRFGLTSKLVEPNTLDSREQDTEDLKANWGNLLREVRYLASVYHTDYPYVQQLKPADDPQLLQRGELMFSQLGCMTGDCHHMGDEQLLIAKGVFKPIEPFSLEILRGDDEEDDESDDVEDDEEEDDYEKSDFFTIAPTHSPSGAPNLAKIAGRVQPRWSKYWIPRPTWIQPGTRMNPQMEPDETDDDLTFFTDPENHKEMEAMFGHTSEQQLDLLIRFLYTAGPKGLSFTTEGQRLDTLPRQQVEVKPLEPPTRQDHAAKPLPDSEPVEDKQPEPAVEPQPDKPESPAAIVAKQTSEINLHNDPAIPYEQSRIVGVVRFEGKRGKPKLIPLAANKFCAAAHPVAPRAEGLIVNDDKTVRNVFIYVKEGLDHGAKWQAPQTPAVLDQNGCIYVPHVIAMMTRQPLHIRSRDNESHNVNLFKASKNPKFNTGSRKGQIIKKMFKKAEFGDKHLTFKSDIHSWMRAPLHVVDHPFVAVSDVEGRFEITGLPPGRYTLETSHEDRKIRPVQFEVQVQEGTSHRADVTVTRR